MKRRASGGWSWIVVMLGLALFAMVMTVLMFASNQVSAGISAVPSMTATYDPDSNTAMNLIFYPGVAIMVAFSAIIEVINLNQRRVSGEEVI